MVLGDSFVEGFGVNAEERFSNILESKTGIEHLNFGTAGAFATTQEWLLYKYLVTQFEHSIVMLAIFPGNDFLEMDIDYGKETFKGFYRPYLVGDYPEFKLTYFNAAYAPLGHDPFQLFRRVFTGFSYSFNAYLHLKSKLEMSKALKSRVISFESYSPYEDYSSADWDRMRFSLEMLMKEARDKKLVLVTIPDLRDVIRFENMNNPESLHLNQEISRFANIYDAVHIDLLPAFKGGAPKDFYLTCDGHWNAYGNATVASYLLEKLKVLGVYK